MNDKKMNFGLLLLRSGLAVLMLFHGIDKINNLGFIKELLSNNGMPEFIAFGVYLGEIVAPILLIIGLRVRAASAIIFINCLVAVLLVFPDKIFALGSHGEWAIELLGLYMLCSLTLMLTGGGEYNYRSILNKKNK